MDSSTRVDAARMGVLDRQTLLCSRLLDTRILWMLTSSERGRRQKAQEDHGDRIGVAFHCPSFRGQQMLM